MVARQHVRNSYCFSNNACLADSRFLIGIDNIKHFCVIPNKCHFWNWNSLSATQELHRTFYVGYS